MFQSTLPRRERRGLSRSDSSLILVSIHAPAQGATDKTPVRVPELKMFQSTLPRRERRDYFGLPLATADVSIHAPAQGATPGR